MSYTIIGTCSICKGPVTVPTVWYGLLPPTPTCRSCGAVPAPDHGPVIKMMPRLTPEQAEEVRQRRLAYGDQNDM